MIQRPVECEFEHLIMPMENGGLRQLSLSEILAEPKTSLFDFEVLRVALPHVIEVRSQDLRIIGPEPRQVVYPLSAFQGQYCFLFAFGKRCRLKRSAFSRAELCGQSSSLQKRPRNLADAERVSNSQRLKLRSQ